MLKRFNTPQPPQLSINFSRGPTLAPIRAFRTPRPPQNSNPRNKQRNQHRGNKKKCKFVSGPGFMASISAGCTIRTKKWLYDSYQDPASSSGSGPWRQNGVPVDDQEVVPGSERLTGGW